MKESSTAGRCGRYVLSDEAEAGGRECSMLCDGADVRVQW